MHRRLFGTNEFAGFVTALAMQKPGIDIRGCIFRRHVVTFESNLDSMSVSRVWSLSVARGHVL